jgi:hypothetical protein
MRVMELNRTCPHCFNYCICTQVVYPLHQTFSDDIWRLLKIYKTYSATCSNFEISLCAKMYLGNRVFLVLENPGFALLFL